MKLKVFASLAFSFFAFVCSILVLIIYLTKHKSKKTERRLFILLLILNIIGCIFEFLHVLTLDNNASYFLCQLCARLHEFFLVTRYYAIMAYVSTITFSYNNNKKSTKKLVYSFIAIAGLINLVLTLCFPLELITDEFLYDYDSTATIYLIAVPFILCTIFISGLFFSNSVRKNELAPLIYTIILIFTCSLLQTLTNVDMNYQNFLLMLISFAFLFTTENQDAKYIEQIEIQNKEIQEINNKQTKFTNNVAASIKDPLNNIIIMSNLLITNDNLSYEEFIKEMEYINKSTSDLEKVLNDINDISNNKGEDNI